MHFLYAWYVEFDLEKVKVGVKTLASTWNSRGYPWLTSPSKINIKMMNEKLLWSVNDDSIPFLTINILGKNSQVLMASLSLCHLKTLRQKFIPNATKSETQWHCEIMWIIYLPVRPNMLIDWSAGSESNCPCGHAFVIIALQCVRSGELIIFNS